MNPPLISAEKLDEMLVRAELAESVTLPIAQYRDLVLQALRAARSSTDALPGDVVPCRRQATEPHGIHWVPLSREEQAVFRKALIASVKIVAPVSSTRRIDGPFSLPLTVEPSGDDWLIKDQERQIAIVASRLHAEYIAACISEYNDLLAMAERSAIDAQSELEKLRGLVNTPEIDLFLRAVHLEAVHQVERWGTTDDRAKRPADWFWLIGYLAGKALHSQVDENTEKALHHCISTAAALYNWHCAIKGVDVRMCPGSSDVERIVEAAFPGSASASPDGTKAMTPRSALNPAAAWPFPKGPRP